MKIGGEEYSKDTGYGNRVKQILIEILDKIDENFEMNASKKGILAVTKEEYKNDFINEITNVEDIVYANMNEENQYTLHFKQNSVGGIYTRTQCKNELGIIPPNIIMIRNDDEDIINTTKHETKHSDQKEKDSDILVSYYNIMQILREGNATSNQEYIRGINLSSTRKITRKMKWKSTDFTITNVSENGYKLPTIIYNKLSYLVGEKEMNKYMQTQNIDLPSFLSDKLDKKYGEGTGLALYQYITNLSFWSHISGEVTQKKIENIYEEIYTKKSLLVKKLDEEMNEDYHDELYQAIRINDDYYEMLETIEEKVHNTSLVNKENFEELTMFQRNKELKGLEELTLTCIEKDIDKISSKNEALDYIQLWDYYRNRCAISKNIYDQSSYLFGEEEMSKEENFELLSKVQHNLYKKCIEYGAFNIQDEQLFDKVIESQLYDLSNTVIAYNDKEKIGHKLIISDQYLTNEFFIQEFADGSKQYGAYGRYETQQTVNGTKILAEREQEKEQEY